MPTPKKHRPTSLLPVVTVLLVLAVSACGGGEATPTGEIALPVEPTKTSTPLPPPTATATETPPSGWHEDETNDAISCQACLPVPGMSLRPVMDITSAQAEQATRGGECFYVFQLEFGRVESFGEIFFGGVYFLDPGRMLQEDHRWCFNSTGQWSFSFMFVPGQPLETGYSDFGDEGYWIPGDDTRFRGSHEGNIVTLNIPCDLIEEDWLWMGYFLDSSGMMCDELGLGPDRAASLPLP